MMLPLSDDERLRYLWHLLLIAAEKRLPLANEVLSNVLGPIENDLKVIKKTCQDYGLPILSGVVSDSGEAMPNVTGDQPQKFRHGISEFPSLNPEERISFEFIRTHYSALCYAAPGLQPRSLSALGFWASLDWEKLGGDVKNELIAHFRKINDATLVPDQMREKSRGIANQAWNEFIKLSSENSFLVIHQRDLSDKLKGLQELIDYYRDQQNEVETNKDRVDALLENTKDDLSKKIQAIVANAEKKARELIEEARGRYPENLLAGYVAQFEEDAIGYGIASRQWLWGLVFSFVMTLATAVHFLGHIQLITLNPVGAFWDEILISVNYLIIWFAVTIGILVAAFYFSKSGSALDRFFKNGVGAFDGVLASLRSAFFVVMAIVPVMVLIYLLSHYFHLRVDVPAVTAKTFLIPKSEAINWAALLSSAAPRVIILALASAVTLFCARMYGIQKNLQAINRYRATALASFVVFINAAGDVSEDAKERKDRLFDELATLIYSPIQTGFNRDSKISPAELSELVTAVSKAMK